MFHSAQFVTAAHRFIVLVKLFIHMECYRETECFYALYSHALSAWENVLFQHNKYMWGENVRCFGRWI